jgi:hypothetical protein
MLLFFFSVEVPLSEAVAATMRATIRFWSGFSGRLGVAQPWFEWRRVNGARGGRGGTPDEAVRRIWAVYGPAWVSSVMLLPMQQVPRGEEPEPEVDHEE